MLKKQTTSALAHKIPPDLQKALKADLSALERWEDITPLARNEWICWTIATKKPETRKNHVDRTVTELLAGKRALVVGPAALIAKVRTASYI